MTSIQGNPYKPQLQVESQTPESKRGGLDNLVNKATAAIASLFGGNENKITDASKPPPTGPSIAQAKLQEETINFINNKMCTTLDKKPVVMAHIQKPANMTAEQKVEQLTQEMKKLSTLLDKPDELTKKWKEISNHIQKNIKEYKLSSAEIKPIIQEIRSLTNQIKNVELRSMLGIAVPEFQRQTTKTAPSQYAQLPTNASLAKAKEIQDYQEIETLASKEKFGKRNEFIATHLMKIQNNSEQSRAKIYSEAIKTRLDSIYKCNDTDEKTELLNTLNKEIKQVKISNDQTNKDFLVALNFCKYLLEKKVTK